MPEFKVFTTINAPYTKVWECASVISELEKWSPVHFTNVSPEERIINGLKLVQTQKLFGVFGRKNLFVGDAYTDSKVRRQFSFIDVNDKMKMNRVTYMFDDNSITTMIALSEDPEAINILKEQAKEEPEFQIDVMLHVYYTFGNTFWRQVAEWLFISPFFKLIFESRAKKALARLKSLVEGK